MTPLAMVAIVLGGPFLAMAILGIAAPLRRTGRPAAYVSIAGITASLAASILLFLRFHDNPEPWSREFLWAPFSSAELEPIHFGVLIDGLSATMFIVVALVAFIVQVYSLGYMSEEERGSLGRYFTFHSLFAFAMLGLVASHNTLQTYAFWELVGLGSYLLIGFWYKKPEAARAAMKAFWTTRGGDVGFAIGVVFLWAAPGGSFVFQKLFNNAESGELSGMYLTLGVIGLFLGAAGKSAQFPFHIWLPDAMEGPTPVSALIHAATMVAAGVYLMVRISPLLEHTPQVAFWIMTIGAFTAFLAASMALVARDVKRILAFSTVSQLGYMMTAVGAGAALAGYFHLTTHAWFKALLFLTAGSVIHAMHTNDIFEMGGLWKKMPVTGAYFLIGGLALSGIFPLAGYFSKDEILIDIWVHGHPVVFWVLLITAAMTAFYMFRAFFLVFFGRRDKSGHAHESPAVMTVPMGILAVLAVIAGWPWLKDLVHSSMHHSLTVAKGAEHASAHPTWIPIAGTVAAVLGILLAYLGYQKRAFSPEKIHGAFGPLSTLLERRYYIDDFFEFLYRWLYLGLSSLIGWIDRFLIDGLVNWLTWLTYAVAERLRRTQTGRAQDALYAIAIGLLLLVFLALRF
jgi:NADH-quinone oxidoreductase subunit L